ncbi:hypothetical protein FRC02_006655 [Tulasnella sp. 418]|nr:hypothetical protein FRC02_006655 [Tulasnella sp. 418]
MSNAAMAKGCEILRREIKLSPELKGTRVVVIDVGEISVSDQSSGHSLMSRTPTPVKHFTRAVGRVVGYAKSHESVVSCHHGSSYTGAVGYAVCGLTLTIRDWWRGDRFSIGAGASSYSLASRLPIRFLDILLLLPRRILSYRDWLRREAIHADRQAREMARERHREKERADQKQAETPIPPVPQQRPSGPPKLIQHLEEVPVPPASSSKAPSTASGALSDIDSLPSDVDHDSLSIDGHSEAESESGKSDRLSASWVSLKEGSDENERMDGSTTTIGESATHQEANEPVA